MYMKKISLAAVVIGIFLGIHSAAEAAGSATALTTNTGLYTLNYTFTTEDFELSVPVLTERTDSQTSSRHGYSITTTEDGSKEAGTAYGLMLSNLPIVDGHYRIPKNTQAELQLVVLLRLDTSDPRAKYGLQVQNVPYTKIKGGETEQINITTTSSYRTNEIGLNK